ncbi:uncharacterized protein LOC117336073 isoform X2 [Pecten maximus]|uniref:uncharacterized protein LOC117336073 isoform X2 n=1 Tax=Pecten maximus TaxID=6579 RepID=UPI0014581FA5|nr:uncharacterized protein LOC117336073 isoform X2 [Pecten maximus]
MATGGQSSSHPCHNLSNPSKRLFWCRHCMAKFIDPIQRWRHSKTCKKIVSSNPRQEIVSTDGRILQVVAGTTEGSVVVSNLAPLEEPEPSVSKRKIRKLVMNDLKCQICERVFVSLDEMREHVKHPCRKVVPFEEPTVPVTGVSITLPDFDQKVEAEDEDEKASALNSLEANLQQMEQSLAMRSDVADEVVANQIESLLKAAQVLQQQQQQEQQSTTYQLLGTEDLVSNVDTQYVITSNPDQYQDVQQFEAVTVETVATLENIVPQVAMCPEVAQQQVVLQPNIEPDDLQLISEVIAREEPEIGKHHSFVPPSSRTSSTSSPPPYPVPAVEQTEELTNHCQGISVDEDSQISHNKDSRNSTNSEAVSHSVGPATTNTFSSDSECVQNSLNNEDSHESVCSKDETNNVVKPKPSNCCENGCCYDPTVDDFGFRNLIDDNDSQINGPTPHCTCKLKSTSSQFSKSKRSPSTSRPPPKPPKYKVHETAKKMRTRSTSVEEEKSVPNKVIKKKRKYIGGKGSLDCVARSKRKKLKKTALQNASNVNSNTAQTTGSVEKQNCEDLGSHNSETKETEIQSNVCLPQTVTRKPKPAREPKCRICDRVFKSIQLLQKHNKVPCKIKHTRNLCQKVLRPKRAPVERPTSLKQKPKQNLTNKKSNKNVLRPQLLPVRRISDTTLFILPKAKKGGKKRRKSAPVFVYSPPVKEYKNTFLGIHMTYKSLPFKEKFFFDLGMISSVHLNKDRCDPRMMDSSLPGLDMDQSSQEISDVVGPCTPPPVLEKIPDLDFFPIHSPTSCLDLEPPVLEVISDLRFEDSSPEVITTSDSTVFNRASVTPVMSPLPPATTEVPPVLDTNGEDKTSSISASATVNSVTHNEQNELGEENSSDRTSGHEGPESVQEQMSEIFTKYFISPKSKKESSNCKSEQQAQLLLKDSMSKDTESLNSEPADLQEVVSIHNQGQMFDIQTEDISSPKECVLLDVVQELSPGGDRNVYEQAHTQSEVNEKTAVKSQDKMAIPFNTTLQTETEPHATLDTEQSQEGQGQHFPQKANYTAPNLLLIGDNTMDNSEMALELPVCGDVSAAGDLEHHMSGTTAPCGVGIHMIVNTELNQSADPSTHTDFVEKEHLTKCHGGNIQNSVAALSSPSKSSTTRHFTDLLADICSSQQSEGLTTIDSSIWSKAQENSPHNEPDQEVGSSNLKSKEPQKLGERHFMDAIMAAALDIGKSASVKVDPGSNGMRKTVQKVTVAVQTDADSFTAKIMASRTDIPSTELICADMVGSETFETSSKVKPTEKTDNVNLETSDLLTKHDTCISPNDIDIFPNKTGICSDPSPMFDIQLETYPVQSTSQECGAVESQNIIPDHSPSPITIQKQLPLNEISLIKSSKKPGLSKEPSPQKSEGRNLFESLFSSLGKESDSNDRSLSSNSESATYPPNQNTYCNNEEAVTYPPTQKTHCNNEEATTYPPTQNNTPCNNEEATTYPLTQNLLTNKEALIYSPLPKNMHSDSLPNKEIFLKEKLAQNVHIPQPNSQEVIVFPPPGSKLTEQTPESSPQFVGRTASLPLGISRDIPDIKNRTNLLEMVAKSLGIYSDENQDPQSESSAGKQTEATDFNIGTKNTQSEKSSVFVNIPFVQPTSCIDEAEDSSVQIIVMNNQSTSSNYTTDINVIDLPAKPELTKEQHNGDRLHQDKCTSQQTCSTCAVDILTKCSCNADKNGIPSAVSKPVTSQKPGVKVVMCGVEDLKKWDNSGVVVANKSSLQLNSNGQRTGCLGTWHGQESVNVSEQSKNQKSNLCNTLSQQGNREVDERHIHYSDATSGSNLVGQNSFHASNISSTSYLTPVSNVYVSSSSEALTQYNIHSDPGVTVVTDIHLSTTGTNNVSEQVAMVTEDVNKPVAMDTDEALPEVTMVTNLHSSVASEKVNVCSGSWGEPKVMVQYVQDFDCDQNVSYIVLDNEQEHDPDPFVMTESPFLQTGETILCQEEENLLNSKEPLQAAVMN